MTVLISLTAAFAMGASSPVLAVLYLISVFTGVSIYLLLLGLGLLGLAYLILYVGAIAMFFLFVVILLESQVNLGADAIMQRLVAPLLPGLVALVLLAIALPPAQIWWSPWSLFREYCQPTLLGHHDSIQSSVLLLYSERVLQFLVTGVLLLVAMVGSILVQVVL